MSSELLMMQDMAKAGLILLLMMTVGSFAVAIIAALSRKRRARLFLRIGLVLGVLLVVYGVGVPLMFIEVEESSLTRKEATDIALAAGFRAVSKVIDQRYPDGPPIRSPEELEQAVIAETRAWSSDEKHNLRFDPEGHILDGWGQPLRFACTEDGYLLGMSRTPLK